MEPWVWVGPRGRPTRPRMPAARVPLEAYYTPQRGGRPWNGGSGPPAPWQRQPEANHQEPGQPKWFCNKCGAGHHNPALGACRLCHEPRA
eukprot:7827426-Alexandrium_andersonii.AAC.1